MFHDPGAKYQITHQWTRPFFKSLPVKLMFGDGGFLDCDILTRCLYRKVMSDYSARVSKLNMPLGVTEKPENMF